MYSKAGTEDRIGQDYDSSGHLSMPLLDQIGVPRNAEFYLCGPPSFLTEFNSGLKAWGVLASRIHTEIFGPEESITPGIASSPQRTPHPPAGNPGHPGPALVPQVSFTRSGLTVAWDSRFQSLLELAEACDVPVKWSCRTGVCHTCECALIGGAINYFPEPIELPAEGNVLTCCSQPRADVQIDL